MVYSTSKCPSCGEVIRRQTNPVKQIASPFERCRYCGITYLNSYKEEWITKSPDRRFFFFIQSGVWARAVILPVFVLTIPSVVFDLNVDSAGVLILWPVLSVTWLIGGYFFHKKAEQGAIAASVERTKDPKYLDLLKKAGYKIYPIGDPPSAMHPQPKTEMTAHESVPASIEICFCRKCGQKLVAGSLYCNKCGEKVVEMTNK